MVDLKMAIYEMEISLGGSGTLVASGLPVGCERRPAVGQKRSPKRCRLGFFTHSHVAMLSCCLGVS